MYVYILHWQNYSPTHPHSQCAALTLALAHLFDKLSKGLPQYLHADLPVFIMLKGNYTKFV